MDIKAEALKKHYEWHGKIEVTARSKVRNSEDLSLAYTPGVAEYGCGNYRRYCRARTWRYRP